MVNFSQERQKDLDAMQNTTNVRDEFKTLNINQLQEQCKKDRLPFDACFLNITSDLNVSAGIRTLHLMGADTIFILGKKKLDRRALVGAEFYQKIEYLGGLDQEELVIDEKVFLQMISKNENYFPIFVEMGGEDFHLIDWKNTLKKDENTLFRPLLIFGNEHRGIQQNILNLQNKMERSIIASIPMTGVLRSLNVSASVAIASWHLTQQVFF